MRAKKGLTLVELLIAMALLVVIMSAVSSIFATALRNYQVQVVQNTLQRDLNVVLDDISRSVKDAVEIPTSYEAPNGEVFIRTPNSSTLVLALPAIDENQQFIYNQAGRVEKDYLIFQLIESELHKKIFAYEMSSRFPQNNSDKIVLEDISQLSFNYFNNSRLVETKISLEKGVLKTSIKINGENKSVKRNEESIEGI